MNDRSMAAWMMLKTAILPWSPPIAVLTVTVGAAIITTMIATVFPAKKIAKTEIINVCGIDGWTVI